MRFRLMIVGFVVVMLSLCGCKSESGTYYTRAVMQSLKEKAESEKATPLDTDEYAWGLLISSQSDLRNYKKALALALKNAEESKYKDASYLDTLALAYMENNSIDDAIKYQTMAIELLDQNARKVPLYARKPLETRLKFYVSAKELKSIKPPKPENAVEIAELHNSFAWLVLTEPTDFVPDDVETKKISLAYQLAQNAVTITRRSESSYLDTLALAAFVNGKTDEAIEIQKEAVEALPVNASRKNRMSLECVLEFYKQSKRAPSWSHFKAFHGGDYGDHIPMILVHGDGSENADQFCRWEPFINTIRTSPVVSRKFDIYVWKHDTSMPVGFNGSTGNAKELADFINREFPNKPVLLIAHSRGGLVCRSYMNYNEQGKNVIGLITLGTPHHGSPLAVPDLVGISCSMRLIGKIPIFWENYYTKGSDVFDLCRCGNHNLAWDNMDDFLTNQTLPHENFRLCQSDFNDVDYSCDSYYPVALKSLCGTLADLNRREAHSNRIIAYGAYNTDKDDSLSITSFCGAFCENKIINDKNACAAQLKFGSNLMARIHENITNVKPNYLANDGLVPIQSALFLDISEGKVFAHVGPRGSKIGLNEDVIQKSQKVLAHRFILDGNHFTFLSDPGSYSDMIAKDIDVLLSLKSTVTAPVAENPAPVYAPPPAVDNTWRAAISIKNSTGGTFQYETRWKVDSGAFSDWKAQTLDKGYYLTEWIGQGVSFELRLTQLDGAVSIFALDPVSVDKTKDPNESSTKRYKITGNRKFPYKVIEE